MPLFQSRHRLRNADGERRGIGLAESGHIRLVPGKVCNSDHRLVLCFVSYAFALIEPRICSGPIRMNRLSNDTRIFFPEASVKMTTISAATTSPDGSATRT